MKDDQNSSGKEVLGAAAGDLPFTKRGKRKPAMALRKHPARLELEDGFYRIIACDWKGAFIANAHAGQRRIEHATGESLEHALEQLKALLKERRRRLLGSRVNGVPCAEEYRDALDCHGGKLDENLRFALRVHSAMPEGSASMQAIAHRLRASADEMTDGYARLGRAVGRKLAFRPDGLDGRLRPILSIATAEEGSRPDDIAWTLRPEFTQALRSLSAA